MHGGTSRRDQALARPPSVMLDSYWQSGSFHRAAVGMEPAGERMMLRQVVSPMRSGGWITGLRE